jgi:hypothetical protein
VYRGLGKDGCIMKGVCVLGRVYLEGSVYWNKDGCSRIRKSVLG